MKTMAEVLAQHEDCAFSASGILVCACGIALQPQEVMDDMANLAAHQADALTAAGYGPVGEAQNYALNEAADLIDPFSGIGLSNGATRADVARWLRARASTKENQ